MTNSDPINDPRIAAVQMVSGPDVASNLEQAERGIASAVAAGATLVGLPENFGLMGAHETDKLKHAEADDAGPQQDFLRDAAARHDIWLVGGTVPIATPSGERVRQRLSVYDPGGNRVAYYDKIHLFDVTLANGESYRESAAIEPGDTPVVVDTPVGRLGLTICYDLRFPELYRGLVAAGADILCAPSAFTHATGEAHWATLLRARAIENLACMLAPAQGGEHANGRSTWGHSAIVDPWGRMVAECEAGEPCVTAVVDRERRATTRSRFPALQHRRFDHDPVAHVARVDGEG